MDQDRNELGWLTTSELNPIVLTLSSTLADAVAAFQLDTDMRLLPIVDLRRQPIGAIFEKDVRRLLLNPFGHALLQNPTFSAALAQHIRPCPAHEATDDMGTLVDHYQREDGREGMILTRGGTLFATLSNRRLLMLSATHEQRAQQARVERARRIEEAGARFEIHSGTLARRMIELSDTVQRLAEATVDRSTIAGDRAASVASATVQTRDSMTLLAERGCGLARAFAEIEHSLIGSRSTAEVAVERVIVGGNRARGLMDAAQSIDDVMTLIGTIAGTVNLLALNAAIEAARAGEAGLGFGVVAREIKNLSIQTHDATLAIASKVDALRTDVVDVANDYVEIETAISSMALAGAKIDDAIVREATTTRLIAASVSEASSATHAIEDAARTIAQSASSASSSARDLDRMANELRRGATALGAGVSDLLAELRAA